MGAMWNRGGIAALVIACGACHTAFPSVPSEGGPAWTELTSDHFIVWTDDSPGAGRNLLGVMEHMRQIVFGVSVFNPTSNAKAFVIALRDQYEVRPYVPENLIALAGPPRYPLFQPTILLSTESLDYDRRVTIHELAHVISFDALPVQPRWFAEGLAGYFETMQLDEDTGAFDLGGARSDFLRLLRQPAGIMPIADLFACTELQCLDTRFYPTAWTLFAYLANRRPDDLLRYVRRLTALDHDAQAGAWAEVLPDLTPAKLDGMLSDWIRFGELAVHRYKVKLKDFAVTTRALGDADVYTARALLRHAHHPKGPPPAEVSAALAIDPTNVVAHMVRRAHDGQLSPETARSLTAAHPDDWRAWLLLKLVLKHGAEAQAAHARACSLVASSPATLPEVACSARALADEIQIGR
ncbi:MAG TPA: DUF1570 domain-containing protein [Kofleriaceae bacterium]